MDTWQTMIGFAPASVLLLAAFAGWVIIGGMPVSLQTPCMSGANLIHGIVGGGGIFALFHATNALEGVIGFAAVLFCAANAGGGSGETRPHRAKSSAPRPVSGRAAGQAKANVPLQPLAATNEISRVA